MSSQQLSPQALKAQADAREPSGRFGNQLHPVDPTVSIGAPAPTYRERATALAARQREAAESLIRQANDTLVSLAAEQLEETHPHIMAVTLQDGYPLRVSQAWDENSDSLPEEDRRAVQEALRAAGVKPHLDYTHPGIHLRRMRDWEPDSTILSTPRSIRRAERALAAGSFGAPHSAGEQLEGLLTDFRHLAAEKGIDFDHAVAASSDHFDDETAEDRLAAD